MTADKITTRQKISAASKNLFSTHGYSQTTIDDIITSAGVTKGAFYHHFKSKETICSEIIDSMQSEYQNIFESLPKKTNPLEKLKALIKQILELNDSGQWVNCKLILRLSYETQLLQTTVKQKLDAFWKWYIDQYRQLITQCRDLKLISDKLSAQQQTDFIISFLIASIWTKAVFDRGLDEKIIDHIIERL
jgi:AcrR family transcriptional regulator